jgi:glycosyltransferase involved in cell wall biosynthesis
MSNPSLDIIIPVWNSPAETRSCIVSVLDSIKIARLIIVNNGCDRSTELMLEEFSDLLGDRAIYMTMKRNIGFVPAANMALNRSDADWALLLRPTETLTNSCVQQILATTKNEQAGIIIPLSQSEHSLAPNILKESCSYIETSDLGFSTIALSKKMREKISVFDEEMDGGQFCLSDYCQRANADNFRAYLLPGVKIKGFPFTQFGSLERRHKMTEAALKTFTNRWGVKSHVAVYLPKEAAEENLSGTLSVLLDAARRGHRFDFFLHRKQYLLAKEKRATCLHTGIRLHQLSVLTPLRALARSMEKLKAANPEIQTVSAIDGIPFPGFSSTISTNLLARLARD